VVGAQAYQPVMGFCILFIDEVRIVGADDLDAILACQINEYRINLFLALVDLLVSTGFLRLMALEFDIIILSEEVLEPLNGLFRFGEIATFYDTVQDLLRQLTAQAGGAADDTLMPFFQQLLVDTCCVVERVGHVSV